MKVGRWVEVCVCLCEFGKGDFLPPIVSFLSRSESGIGGIPRHHCGVALCQCAPANTCLCRDAVCQIEDVLLLKRGGWE